MIRLRGLTKRFGASAVVDDLTLDVAAGERLVLLGPSGCGKTTTLKMINRLVEPTDGTITIDEIDTATMSAVALRRSIGYVFQGVGLFPHLSVGRNVGIVGELIGWSRADRERRTNALLELVGLPPGEYRDRLPRELSGGQRQRVGVARALFAKPSVMLLDEPFGALDPLTRDALQQEFMRIQRDAGMSIVFVTHDMTEALLLGDRIAVMDAGQLVQIGSPHQLLTEPANDFVARLMETPKRQADQLEALAADGPVPPGAPKP